MHLYQYLPGTYKATSHGTPHNNNNNRRKSHESVESNAKSSASTNKTPAISNLSRNKYATPKDNVQSQQRPVSSKMDRRKSVSPARQRSSSSVDQHRPSARRNSMSSKQATTTSNFTGNTGGPSPGPIKAQETPYELTVGHGFSTEESVVSEITNPTTMTYPKIGSGYSDSITVNSDLTIPTVVSGMVPEEELSDLNEWHAARARAAAATTRNRQRPTDQGPSLSSIQEGASNVEKAEKQRPRRSLTTFETKTKTGRYPPRDIDNRLELLKHKSMRSLDGEDTTVSSSSSSSKQEEKKQDSSHHSPSDKSWLEDKEPTRTPSEMMEDIVWTTLLHLEEQSVCDEESVATPILQEKHRGRGRAPGGASNSSSSSKQQRKSQSSNKRGKSQPVERGQNKSFSFVW